MKSIAVTHNITSKIISFGMTGAVLLAVMVLFSGCDRIAAIRNRGAAAAPAAPEAPVFAVNTMTVTQGQIQDYLSLSGDIVSSSTVDVYSEAAGKVIQVYVSVGSQVRRDQAIAAVDPSRPGMNYEANIVRSPITGTVVTLPAQVGMTISQTVPLARIAGGNALEIKLYVAERFISKMAAGLSCEIELDAYPGETFRGRVTEVSPTVDPASRTMEIHVGVDNSSSRLKAGMFAKVRIITEQKNNIVKIPASALIQRFGEDYVFVAEPDLENLDGFTARKKNVSPGILIDGILEVQQGLKPDEDIIVRGQSLLNDGAKINIVDRVAPLSAN